MTINATTGTQAEPNLASFKRALDLILTRQIDMSPLISHVFNLDRIEEAMAHAAELKFNARKVLFKF